MLNTRSVTAFLLVAATTVALALAGATAASAEPHPTNRGWTTSAGSAQDVDHGAIRR